MKYLPNEKRPFCSKNCPAARQCEFWGRKWQVFLGGLTRVGFGQEERLTS